MIKLVNLIFFPEQLAKDAENKGESFENSLRGVHKLRASYYKALKSLLVLVAVSIVSAYSIGQVVFVSIESLQVLRFVSSLFVAFAVLSKLGQELQTWKGETLAEEINDSVFNVFYKLGLVGLLTSILLNASDKFNYFNLVYIPAAVILSILGGYYGSEKLSYARQCYMGKGAFKNFVRPPDKFEIFFAVLSNAIAGIFFFVLAFACIYSAFSLMFLVT